MFMLYFGMYGWKMLTVISFFCHISSCLSELLYISACESDADVSIILQSSASLGENQYYELLKYVTELILNLNLVSGQHRVAMETYSAGATSRFNLNDFSDGPSIVNQLDYVFSGGVTNTESALENMNIDLLVNGARTQSTVGKVGVLISDGFSIDRDAAFNEATVSHGDGTGIFTTAFNVKGKYSRRMLQGITSDPDSMNYMEGKTLQEMLDMIPQLLNGICRSKFWLYFFNTAQVA